MAPLDGCGGGRAVGVQSRSRRGAVLVRSRSRLVANLAHIVLLWFTETLRIFSKDLRSKTTVCPWSSDPSYVVSYYIKWVTTSWIYGAKRKIYASNGLPGGLTQDWLTDCVIIILQQITDSLSSTDWLTRQFFIIQLQLRLHFCLYFWLMTYTDFHQLTDLNTECKTDWQDNFS